MPPMTTACIVAMTGSYVFYISHTTATVNFSGSDRFSRSLARSSIFAIARPSNRHTGGLVKTVEVITQFYPHLSSFYGISK